MWYLINSAGKRLYLQSNKEVTFGRKKSDILLQDDESISRLHASICIKPKEIIKINEPTSTCELKDTGSKYGTYIIVNEEEKIQVTKEGYKLKDQDTVQFGLQFHRFTVVYMPIMVVVSSINDTDKIKLQSILDEIDGMICAEWTCNCTHLTVSKANLTEKVTWAMASAVPIVNINYWEEFKYAVHNGNELPKPIKFVPPIKETLVNSGNASLSVNEKRKTLFQHLIFVYFSVRQYKMFGKMITMAGGKSVLYSKKRLSLKDLCASNVIVLQYSDNDSTQSSQTIVPEYDKIYNALRESKRKMISETEIPLAILYCSVEKHCNPKFSFTEFLRRSELKSDSTEILALDTQDVMSDVRILPKVISNVPIKSNFNVKNTIREVEVIPETYDESYSLSSNDISESQDRWKNMPKASQETKNTVNNNILIEKENKRKVKEIFSQRITRYIPETCDSSFSDASQKDTQCSIQRTPSLRQKDTNSQEISLIKESMIANKGSPIHEVIDLSDEEEEDKISNKREYNKNSNNILSQEKLDKLLSAHCLENEGLKAKKINPSQKKLSGKVDDNNIPKEVSQTVEKHVKTPMEKNRRSVELQDDEEFIKPTSKKFCLENSTIKSANQKSLCSENYNNSSNILSRSSSFLRASPNFKKFKKVNNVIPQQRIKFSDMHVWHKYNQQNLNVSEQT